MYEVKKFIFYCVKIVFEEVGIELGWVENGIVKCVFIFEMFLIIFVIVFELF